MPHYNDWIGTSHSELEDSEQISIESEDDIYIRENSIYTFVDGSTWEEAQDNSKKLGWKPCNY